MPHTVKITDDALLETARAEAEAQGRSLAGQILHWARIGRAIERSGSSDYNRLSQVLAGKQPTTILSPEEEAVWIDMFAARMAEPGPEEEGFYSRRRSSGTSTGLDDHGDVPQPDPPKDR